MQTLPETRYSKIIADALADSVYKAGGGYNDAFTNIGFGSGFTVEIGTIRQNIHTAWPDLWGTKRKGGHKNNRNLFAMGTKVIQYRFLMPNNSREEFKLELNARNLELEGNIPAQLPGWAKLDSHQCPNCTLDVVAHSYCPLAANIVNIVRRFDGLGLASYDKIKLDVITEERHITQQTTVQKGISSMMGLIIATCGCPHTAFFKPMAQFHLPLASKEETIFRAASMYLLAQYYLKKDCQSADFELEGLAKIYHNIRIVNVAIAQRLRAATITDSLLNALVLLDSYAQFLSFAIEESLEEIRHLFSPFLTNKNKQFDVFKSLDSMPCH